jgi:hypothetical protein
MKGWNHRPYGTTQNSMEQPCTNTGQLTTLSVLNKPKLYQKIGVLCTEIGAFLTQISRQTHILRCRTTNQTHKNQGTVAQI